VQKLLVFLSSNKHKTNRNVSQLLDYNVNFDINIQLLQWRQACSTVATRDGNANCGLRREFGFVCRPSSL